MEARKKKKSGSVPSFIEQTFFASHMPLLLSVFSGRVILVDKFQILIISGRCDSPPLWDEFMLRLTATIIAPASPSFGQRFVSSSSFLIEYNPSPSVRHLDAPRALEGGEAAKHTSLLRSEQGRASSLQRKVS